MKNFFIVILSCFFCLSLLCHESDSSVISYDYNAYVMTPSHGKEFPEDVDLLAQEVYGFIPQSHLFQASVVKDPMKVRKYVSSTSDVKGKAESVKIRTKDGIVVPCLYFNRGSNKMIVVGSGFTNPKELMSQFAAIYLDYDLVVFDCRGHSHAKMNLFDCSSWSFNLAQMLFEVDASKVAFGLKEHNEVMAVVSYFKKAHQQKYGEPYKAVYGVGICYSALIILKTLALYPEEHIFDKVVLDGCWISLFDFIHKVRQDPALLISPQKGGVRDHWFFKKEWVKDTIKFFAQHVIGLPIAEDVSIRDDLSRLPPIPYLFIYGKNDLVVGRETFEELWKGVSSPYKVGFISSEPHVRNHRRPERYRLISEAFFNKETPDEWLSLITNKMNLKKYLIEKIEAL